jgi:hypothetical protein
MNYRLMDIIRVYGGIFMKKHWFLLACIMLMTGCQAVNGQILNANESDMPGDFNFLIDYGICGNNRIDTYSGTFTKDLIIAGTETIDFTIPADKMREIYHAFAEYEVSGLPDDINSEIDLNIAGRSYTTHEPYAVYALTYTCNEETRTIVCNDGGPWYADSGPPDTRGRLVAFVTYITEYIYSTEDYKNMSPAEGGYL